MSEVEASDIKFRDDTLERRQVAERNKEAAKRILEKAGFSPENPDYKHYFALTMANVHNTNQYGFYDDNVEEMFVETLKNPDMKLAQYREGTKQYRIKVIERQQKKASGSIFNNKDESYEALIKPYQETLKSGVAMRHETGVTFPKEFYDDNGNPVKRLVVEMDGNSSWNIVNEYALKHQESGLSFNGEAFVVDGVVQNPGKFFNSKSQKLEKFVTAVQKQPEMLDLTDKELLDLVEKGDYEGVKELNKQRGMVRDNRNKPLRELLKADKDLFAETRTLISQTGGNGESLVENISGLSQKMKFNAELFHKETESGKFHAPKEDIDRVIFSVRPDDVAKQSTFQDWKSCMNAVGCNHRYVDDAIGQGSIIAYGYNSKNPQKMISRILIHPYTDEVTGKTIYLPNSKLYGENNAKFKETVAEVVEKRFNEGKTPGFYMKRPGLYNDGDPQDINLLKNIIDYSAYKGIVFKNKDFSECEKVTFGDNATLENCTLGKNVKLGDNTCLHNMTLEDMDLSGAKNLKLNNCTLGKDIKLPEKLTIVGRVPEGTDLSGVKDLKFGDNVVLGKDVKLPDGADLSGVKKLMFCDNVVLGKDIKWPEKLTIDGIVPDGTDLSGVKDLTFCSVGRGKDIKLPEKLTIGGIVPDGTDLSMFKDLTLNVSVLDKDVKLPESICVNHCLPTGANLSTVKKIVVKDSYSADDFLELPDNIDVKFKGGVEIKNAETANKLLQKDLSEAYLAAEDMKLFKNMEIPSGIAVATTDGTGTIIAVNANEELKKELDSVVEQGAKVKYVTEEEFAKLSEANFVKRTTPLAEKASSAIVSENAAIKEIKEKAAASAAKFEAKAAAKSGSAAVKTAADLTAKKSGILAKAAAANAKFDKAVDKTVEKGTQALNNSAVGKAYHKAAEKVGETKAAQAVTKTVSKGAQKVASTTAGKAVTKTVAKVAGSAVGKSVLKKIPLVSAGAGAYFAWQRIKDGQWKLAGCEMASGIAGCFPGLGTAASVAIDAGLVANDIHEAVKSNKEAATTKTTSEKIAQANPKVLPKPKSTDFEKKDDKKEVKKTTLTTAQQLALMNKSRA